MLTQTPDLKEVYDLISLPTVSEDTMLDVLSERYRSSEIYTNAGNTVLIAINPFRVLPLYTMDIMNKYKESDQYSAKSLPPHPWKTANNCFSQMYSTDIPSNTSTKYTQRNRDQSILISGESGAGKTETTKVIISYLANVSSSNSCTDANYMEASSTCSTIQDQVLHANPVLEAFGNARTVRNDNSSRFGKYVRLLFSNTGQLISVSLNAFLLEMPRLITQADGERNFHIFYMILSCSNPTIKMKYHLNTPDSYYYLNQTSCFIRRDGISDSFMFDQLTFSFTRLGFQDGDIDVILRAVVAILTLGNVRFCSQVTPSGETLTNATIDSKESIAIVSDLLGVPDDVLVEMLVSKDISVAGETLMVTLDSAQSIHARDSLAKSIYLALFTWILDDINMKMRSSIADVLQSSTYIGLLDVFGFESLDRNSFEQLLINYANECLQSQFNARMIELEQQLYVEQGIQWEFIDFPNNKDCIDLIANKKLSILSLLHEASISPSGSDSVFVNRVYTALSSHPRLKLSSMAKAKSLFSIKHFAGTVCYDSHDFINKNKGRPCHFNVLLCQSCIPFFINIGKKYDFTTKDNKSLSNSLQSTNSISFRESLADLMSTIESTEVYYIRCLKPNDQNVRERFSRERIRDQLQNGGVFQTLSMIRRGFPVRISKKEFCYFCKAVLPFIPQEIRLSSVDKIIAAVILLVAQQQLAAVGTMSPSVSEVDNACNDLGIQIGKSIIFFRQKAFAAMELFIKKCELRSITMLQTCARTYFHRKRYVHMRASVTLVQSIIRMRSQFHVYRKQVASAVTIQAAIRRKLCLSKLFLLQKAVCKIQLWWLHYKSRKKLLLGISLRRRMGQLLILQRWWIHVLGRIRRSSTLKKEVLLVPERRNDVHGGSPTITRRVKSQIIEQEMETNPSDREAEYVLISGSAHSYRHKKRNSLVVPMEIPDEVFQILRANRHALWDIAHYYSPQKQQLPSPSSTNSKCLSPSRATSPSPKCSSSSSSSSSISSPSSSPSKTSNYMPILPVDAVYTLAQDWGICPTICGRSLLMDVMFSILDNQEWEWDDAKISFTQFEKVLYMLTIYVKGFPQAMSEEDRIRFLLRVMDTSEGRYKRMQLRTGGLVPKFVNVEFFQPRSPSSQSVASFVIDDYNDNDNNASQLDADIYPEPEPRVLFHRPKSCEWNLSKSKSEDFYSLPKPLIQNQLILWTVFKCYALYCSDSVGKSRVKSASNRDKSPLRDHQNIGKATAGNQGGVVHMPSEAALWSLLRDFNVSPSLCSLSFLKKAINELATDNGQLVFVQFLHLLNKIARDNIVFAGPKHVTISPILVLLTTMDRSKGRLKMVKLSRNVGIPPPFIIHEAVASTKGSYTANGHDETYDTSVNSTSRSRSLSLCTTNSKGGSSGPAPAAGNTGMS